MEKQGSASLRSLEMLSSGLSLKAQATLAGQTFSWAVRLSGLKPTPWSALAG